MQIPHLQATFSSLACCVLHRIAFPVGSEWYQQKHSSFTILLTRGTHSKYVQYLAKACQHPANPRSLLSLDALSGRNTADEMYESLG